MSVRPDLRTNILSEHTTLGTNRPSRKTPNHNSIRVYGQFLSLGFWKRFGHCFCSTKTF